MLDCHSPLFVIWALLKYYLDAPDISMLLQPRMLGNSVTISIILCFFRGILNIKNVFCWKLSSSDLKYNHGLAYTCR